MDTSFSRKLNAREQLTSACWQVNPTEMANPTPMNRLVVVRCISHFSKLSFLQSLADLATEREHHSMTLRAVQIPK